MIFATGLEHPIWEKVIRHRAFLFTSTLEESTILTEQVGHDL